jgi:hypothetical protein
MILKKNRLHMNSQVIKIVIYQLQFDQLTL